MYTIVKDGQVIPEKDGTSARTESGAWATLIERARAGESVDMLKNGRLVAWSGERKKS